MADKTMAIIKRPKYGVEERAGVCLRFETYTTESTAASQFLNQDQAAELLRAYGVDDVAKLDGRPCWVDTSEKGLIKYLGSLVIR